MPQNHSSRKHSIGWLSRARRRAEADRQTRYRDLRESAIGRPLLTGISLPDDLQKHIKPSERGKITPDIAGIIQVSPQMLRRYVGRTLLHSANVEYALPALPRSARRQLAISRQEIQLAHISDVGDSAMYRITAPIVPAGKNRDQTQAALKEMLRLEEAFGIDDNNPNPMLWLGKLTLPKGSGALPDIQLALDEHIPDRVEVGAVQLMRPDTK